MNNYLPDPRIIDKPLHLDARDFDPPKSVLRLIGETALIFALCFAIPAIAMVLA